MAFIVNGHARPVARRLRWGWLIVAMATATTVLGITLSIRPYLQLSSDRPANSSPVKYVPGDDVPTSFGIVAVEFVRNVDGVTHRALAGATHGVSGLVGEGQQQIQVAVALTNRGSRPVSYSVRQFELRATVQGKTTVLRPTAGDLPDGRILPDAGIEGHLDFSVPAATATASLAFADPGSRAPVVIDLGVIATPSSGPTHAHG
jgi:hypothetical protein